ncbi:hypothetical protein [Streptomyces sp. SPB4]|uniref:hypothetical protein n=1 Tax=Streptomyces sp. SPB4 TaxID=2940553 RepID=UPI0024735ABA|nr:hypothetical protein [Streptomyces sp. SPB4]MDH6545878.1 hypothetical protein [Streptomyces sp. SPB4]
MNTLLKSETVAAVDRFWTAHGPIESWMPADFEAYETLTAIAWASRPVGGTARIACRRAVAIVVVGYALGLYMVAGLARGLRGGIFWMWLEERLEAVIFGPVAQVDNGLRSTGDLLFRRRVERVGHGVTGTVDWLVARLGRA